jgi:hypothetical protein
MMVESRYVELPTDDEDDGETEAEPARKTKLPQKRANATSQFRGTPPVRTR